MTTRLEQLLRILETAGEPINQAECREVASLLRALSSTPEDVAQLAGLVVKQLEDEGKPTEDCCDRCHYRAVDSEAIAAVQSLAAAAARVPGLEAQGQADWNALCIHLGWAYEKRDGLPPPNRAVCEAIGRMHTAESERDAARRELAEERAKHTAFQDAVEASASRLEEKVAHIEAQTTEAIAQRDAARQEVERLQEEVKDARAAAHSTEGIASDALKENERLTARVAELEDDRRLLRERMATAETEGRALAAAHESAEARATAAEAKVQTLAAAARDLNEVLGRDDTDSAEYADAVSDARDHLREAYGNTPTQPAPSPTPARGLRKAAGPSTACLHCGQRRAEHIRRHHGNGPKGTLWYCRTPTERPFIPRPSSLDAAVRAALTGPLAWMLGPDSDWKDGEVGVGHGFRGQANEAHALLTAGLADYDAARGGEATQLVVSRFAESLNVHRCSTPAEQLVALDNAEKARKWDAAVERAKDEEATACVMLGIDSFRGSGIPPSHKAAHVAKAKRFARWLLGLDTSPSGPRGERQSHVAAGYAYLCRPGSVARVTVFHSDGASETVDASRVEVLDPKTNRVRILPSPSGPGGGGPNEEPELPPSLAAIPDPKPGSDCNPLPPALTPESLAAVVGRLRDFMAAVDDADWEDISELRASLEAQSFIASETLFRALSGQVPEVVLKSRVAGVLQHLDDVVGSSRPEYDRGYRDCIKAVSSMLKVKPPANRTGRDLATAPGTSGGEAERDAAAEAWARAERANDQRRWETVARMRAHAPDMATATHHGGPVVTACDFNPRTQEDVDAFHQLVAATERRMARERRPEPTPEGPALAQEGQTWWACACGWSGRASALKPTPAGGLACPVCGGTGGLDGQTQPTPAAPEVVFEHGTFRVCSLSGTHAGEYMVSCPEKGLAGVVAMARALVDARQEAAGMRGERDAERQIAQEWETKAYKAAESMRERAATAIQRMCPDNGDNECQCDECSSAATIRALPLTEE